MCVIYAKIWPLVSIRSQNHPLGVFISVSEPVFAIALVCSMQSGSVVKQEPNAIVPRAASTQVCVR